MEVDVNGQGRDADFLTEEDRVTPNLAGADRENGVGAVGVVVREEEHARFTGGQVLSKDGVATVSQVEVPARQ